MQTRVKISQRSRMIRDAPFRSSLTVRSTTPAKRSSVHTWPMTKIMKSQVREAFVIQVTTLMVSESWNKFQYEMIWDLFRLRYRWWSWTILWIELQRFFPHNEDWWPVQFWSAKSHLWLRCQARRRQQGISSKLRVLFQWSVDCVRRRGVSRRLHPVRAAQSAAVRPRAVQPSAAHHRQEHRQVCRSE